MNINRILLAVVATGALVVSARSADAAKSPRVNAQPVSLTKTLKLDDCAKAPEPSCAAPAPVCCEKPVCCPKPCVTYRHRGPKLCCTCEAPVPTVLLVKNPCTGCETEVKVCIPACCKGEPKLCCGSGFLGRNTVDYDWCCGYNVHVAFKHNGDLIVTTWGR